MNNKTKYILLTIVTIFCILSCIYIGYCCFSKDNKNKENDKCDMDSSVEEMKTENSLDLTKIGEEKENKLHSVRIKNTILKENSIIKHKDDEVKQQKRKDEVKKANDHYNSVNGKRIGFDERIDETNTFHQEFLDFLKQDNKINTGEENHDKKKIFNGKVQFFENMSKGLSKKTDETSKIDINNSEKSGLISNNHQEDIINNKVKTDSLNQISTEHTQNISEYKPSFYERLFHYIPMTKFNKDNQIKMDKEIKHKNETDNNNEQSITVKPHFTQRISGLVFNYITSLYNFINPKVSTVKDNSKENHKQPESNIPMDNEYLQVTGKCLTLKDKDDELEVLKSFEDKGPTFLITLKDEDVSDKRWITT
ncbi:hypothetical protein SLOPH_562 [Spraguea lophii 42_110]|uniref:Uncharacterized protein n=1 Tax=Spraguea lophii (strain 42_110) TaxID=1358809 RepID=S7W5E3_SPRLO|nr:hypothetical protein SLOPH_562 [Spraguea lophii 42_110]